MLRSMKLLVPAIAVSALLAACGSSSSSKSTSSAAESQPAAPQSTATSSTAVVKTGSVPTLGTVLVNGQGMTLYHLSGEQAGKFICTTSACVQVWHPLTVQAGSTPSGSVAALATVKRPDGTVQVTYKGEPLYTFAEDKSVGEARGQGLKDVGTWSVIAVSGSAGAATTTSSSSKPASSGSEGGGYGY